MPIKKTGERSRDQPESDRRSPRASGRKSMPHVALLVETSRSYGRGVLRGVREYLAEHRPWSVYLEPRGLDSAGPPWLRGWAGDGILSRTATPGTAALIRAARVPVVELRSRRL